MNNSLLTSARIAAKDIYSSYLKNFKLAQINLELNRQEDHFSQIISKGASAAIKKGFPKEA